VAGLIRLPTLGDTNVRENPNCARNLLAQIAMSFALSNQTSLDITKKFMA
jgi:hypothetical protein